MGLNGELDYVVIEGLTYPRVTKWQLWVHRQQWLCRMRLHYFLLAGTRPGFQTALCVCGRCGYSTWWKGNIWTLQVQFGYWMQAGHPLPPWKGEKAGHSRKAARSLCPRW